MSEENEVMDTLRSFLSPYDRNRFDLICVFSVTMWIHLNHGDQGLKTFIRFLCRNSKFLLLEPQPWRCYQTAARRMRKLGQEEFQQLKNLELRGPGVDLQIVQLFKDSGMQLVEDFGESKWSRKLVLLKNTSL